VRPYIYPRINDHTYTNDAYGKTDITIYIEIDAGIGSIDLRLK